MPAKNCKCLALLCRSLTKNRTNEAGTKDMAVTTNMAMSTSVPSNLKKKHLQPVSCNGNVFSELTLSPSTAGYSTPPSDD